MIVLAPAGSITGLCSIWSLVFISYDRYNVIVNGVGGSPLSAGKAFFFILFSWGYGIAWSIPPFFGWGRFIPEGKLSSYFLVNLYAFFIQIFVYAYK